MFDDLIRELRRYERGHTVAIKLPTDEHGYLDRICPAEACKADFKLLASDGESRGNDDPLFCPICRHKVKGDEFTTTAQIEYAKQAAFAHLKMAIGNALETGARRFNQRQRPGFITMSLSVTRDRTPISLPKAIGEAMEQRFVCEKCGIHYSSIGAAYFCPACGHNSVLSTFEQTLKQVRGTINSLPLLRKAFASDRDAAENAARLILEQSLTKLVGGFERFTETLFQRMPAATTAKTKRGSFQRLDEASDLWRSAIGKGYDDLLGLAEFSALRRSFQRRHLIAHRDGIVDSDYLQKSGDTGITVGQRIRIQPDEVLQVVNQLEVLFTKLRDHMP